MDYRDSFNGSSRYAPTNDVEGAYSWVNEEMATPLAHLEAMESRASRLAHRFPGISESQMQNFLDHVLAARASDVLDGETYDHLREELSAYKVSDDKKVVFAQQLFALNGLYDKDQEKFNLFGS